MPPPDPTRSENARRASNARWTSTVDRSAATAPAREAFRAKFAQIADPDGRLDPATREVVTQALISEHFRSLAQRSAKTRRQASTT